MASDELVTTLKAARDSSKTSQEDSFSIADTGNPAMDINTTEPNATSDSFSSSREFTLFPKLPTEMQLLVWKQAIADIEPRIVEVTFEVDFDINTEIAHSPSTTPSLLHTCKNARGEAKKKYNELCVFAEKFTGAVIDYEKDTLFFNTGYATNGILRKAEQALWMRKCRQLALAEQFIFSLQPTRSQPSEFLTKFESLETLSMVSCDWPHNEDGHSVVAGTGNVHFAKHCRHGGQGIWRARILTLVIYHNPNIKNGGPVVTASRVAADSNNLVGENQHLLELPSTNVLILF